MIKILNGIKETVEFEENTPFLMMYNTDFEEYPPHWHAALEIIMPLEGDYFVECNGIPYYLQVNDVLIIAPGALHHIHAARGKRLIFQANLGKSGIFQSFDSFFSYMQPALVISPSSYPSIHSGIVDAMNSIYEESSDVNPFKDASIYSSLINILLWTAREYVTARSPISAGSNSKQQEYIEKFMSISRYVNEHCTEDLTLEAISEMAGFSKYHFSRLFKDFTNTSFHKYLNIQRINYSESLLMDPAISITEVAIRSGFNSISAFMRMFKIIKGCTPTEFRRLHQICDFDASQKAFGVHPK